MIDTTAPVVHDCQCSSLYGFSPVAQYFYRGFLVHCWGGDSYCLFPVEMPVEEAAQSMGVAHRRAHRLGSGQAVDCINASSQHPGTLIDRFWEKLMTREVPSE